MQPVIAGGRVFLGTLAGRLHAMDAATGADAWVFQAEGPILHAAAVAGGRVFIGAGDGSLHAVRAPDGVRVWTAKISELALWNSPAVHGDLVFVGTREGRFLALDAESGRVWWSMELGAPILNSPAVDGGRGRVYVGGEDMRVRAMSVADGKVAWTSERLPGASLRGYHPVIAPDGAVLITSAPVAGYDRFQQLLLDMAREVFGDFASWRHKPEENDRLRAENFRQLERPETHGRQLDYLRRRLEAEPAFQTLFVLDPDTGRQRFVVPVVASESMNGPGAPPLVTPGGGVIIKYQVLLRSRYEHYSPFLNVGWLDTATGAIAPLMDQSRTYGWHDSLLLVHDEQSQLVVGGRWLINTHQDNVNALDLETLKGRPEPFAWNIHEPAPGEALALRLAAMRGDDLTPGNEWLVRGTAVYGGGSVLDVPVVIAGDSFYYLPTHELNSGCALISYRSRPGARETKRVPMPRSAPTAEEWKRIQELPWDWDTLATPRLKGVLEALPAKVPGTAEAPLTAEAERTVAAIPDAAFDACIWRPAMDEQASVEVSSGSERMVEQLRGAVKERVRGVWRPLVLPAGKAPEEAQMCFRDPWDTMMALLLARPFLDAGLAAEVDGCLRGLAENMPRAYARDEGEPRTDYKVPMGMLNVAEPPLTDDLARLYPLWLWSQTPGNRGQAAERWREWRTRLRVAAPQVEDDCGNARLAGLMAYCRLAKTAGDSAALGEALPLTRKAMRMRLRYELAHPRGGLVRSLPRGAAAMARWRRLTPDVARLLAAHARPVQERLMRDYVDHQRPGWWIAWNVEQLMRNEVPFQSPTTPREIFAARALLLGESAPDLARFADRPWCRADEYYIEKLALALRAGSRPGAADRISP